MAERDKEPTQAAPQAVMMSEAMLTQLLQAIQGTANPPSNQDALIESVKTMAEMAKATRASQRISNIEHEDISPFTYDSRCTFCQTRTKHPENNKIGHPRARLKYRTFFCGSLEREDALTPLEIELYNSFTVSRTARNGTWKAIMDVDGTAEVLHIDVPFQGMDARANLPDLVVILFELLQSGENAVTPQNQIALMLDLQKRIKELEGQQAVPVGAR